MSKQIDIITNKGLYLLSSLEQLIMLEPEFYREGYLISSWNSMPDGSGIRLDPTCILENNITAYALWEQMTNNCILALDGSPLMTRDHTFILYR